MVFIAIALKLLIQHVASVGTLAIMSIKDHGIYCNSFKVADPARGKCGDIGNHEYQRPWYLLQ